MFTAENAEIYARWRSIRRKIPTVQSASDVEDVKRYVRHRQSGVGLQANPDTEKYENGTAYKI